MAVRTLAAQPAAEGQEPSPRSQGQGPWVVRLAAHPLSAADTSDGHPCDPVVWAQGE